MDLLGEHLAERATEHGEVLGEQEHLAAVDRAPPGDHTIGERAVLLDAETVGPVAGQHVELDERVGVEQLLDAFPGRELAAGVLALHGRRVARMLRLVAQLQQLIDALLDRVRTGCGLGARNVGHGRKG